MTKGNKRTDTKTPWLTAEGESKDLKTLQEECRTWGPRIWEEYLKTLEVELQETLAPDAALIVEEKNEMYIEIYKSLLTQESFPQLKKVMNAALCTLSKNEQQAIKLVYWKGMNNTQAAKKMDLGRKTFTTYRDRGLKKLANLLLSGAIKKGISFLGS